MQGTSVTEKRILQRVDEVCATMRTTRAEVLYALLRGIVVECLPKASRHTVEQQAPEGETRLARAEAAIMRVMRQRRLETVRILKQATNSKRIAVVDWDRALVALVKAGELRIDVSAQGKKTVTWLKGA